MQSSSPPFAICGEYKFAAFWYDESETTKGGAFMDQQKTGAFLAARRKELGLTQQDLGIQLGVTNKTISRWETGAYLPDLATIPELCRILGISVNEFFRGETIPPEELREQTDRNILDLWEADAGLRRKKFWSELLGGGGTGILLSQVYAPDTPGKAAVIIAGVVMICLQKSSTPSRRGTTTAGPIASRIASPTPSSKILLAKPRLLIAWPPPRPCS
jgi:transcriptional regulator with XRE-family HTH domain